MPILFDPQTNNTNVPKITPKFFDKVLTGNGGTVGLINNSLKFGDATVTPYLNDLLDIENKHNIYDKKGEYVFFKGNAHFKIIPITTTPIALNRHQEGVDQYVEYLNKILHLIDFKNMFHVSCAYGKSELEIFVDVKPALLCIVDDLDNSKKLLYVGYTATTFIFNKSAVKWVDGDPIIEKIEIPHVINIPITYASPRLITKKWLKKIQKHYNIDPIIDYSSELDNWFENKNLYQEIVKIAEIWNSDEMGERVSAQIEVYKDDLNAVHNVIRYLNNYNIPIKNYKTIYDKINVTFDKESKDLLIKLNINLMLADSLFNLANVRDQLATPPTISQAVAKLPSGLVAFSNQQRAAIETQEPLSLTQAGAGTGKSSTILGRVEYLINQGVDPKDILVLSFTNAAADNITEKNAEVSSMTIARMILEIYKANYPAHKLSNIDTLVNTLAIFYPNSEFVETFCRLLIRAKTNKPYATIDLNNFIEEHFDEVIEKLNTVGQTTLELQILIANHGVDDLREPAGVVAKFLIVDEVQDNSVFEFIYLLRYVAKHLQNMFIVGDASQTLYEFRAANPAALTALETSDIFAIYQLTTNYRSNQEILDFANITLADIETNRFANISLCADSLVKTTPASFCEKVKVEYVSTPSFTMFKNNLPAYMNSTVFPYVDECLARGEKVAFLSYQGKSLGSYMQSLLIDRYPDKNIKNITSQRNKDNTVFSEYIKQLWGNISQLPPENAALGLTKDIMNNLDKLLRGKIQNNNDWLTKYLSDWWVENAETISSWVTLHKNGSLATDGFFENLKENLLNFEISRNSIRNYVMNLRNRNKKDENAKDSADLIISTIHGAKGLEFDNVVVFHNSNMGGTQEFKRLYYVAFTRAKNSEMIISYGKNQHSLIEKQYVMVIEKLIKRFFADQCAENGINVRLLSADDYGHHFGRFREKLYREVLGSVRVTERKVS